MPPPDDGGLSKAGANAGKRGGAQALGSASRVIQGYEAIAEASFSMLAAARDENWALVAELEARCRQLIDELKTEGARAGVAGVRMSAAEQRRRIELLRGILANDAEIEARAQPWLLQLEGLITTGRILPPGSAP